MGLLTANLDSPKHSCLTNTKYVNAKTESACQACLVHRKDLGNPHFDVIKNCRTADRLKDDLAAVASAGTAAERTELSKVRGVVVGTYDNPLDELPPVDRQECIGQDALHQV